MISWTPDALAALRARLLAHPVIADLSAGRWGTVAAYFPGIRIPGFRVHDDGSLEVHVVMRWPARVADVRRAVLEALPPDVDPAMVEIHVEDSEVPPSALPRHEHEPPIAVAAGMRGEA